MVNDVQNLVKVVVERPLMLSLAYKSYIFERITVDPVVKDEPKSNIKARQ